MRGLDTHRGFGGVFLVTIGVPLPRHGRLEGRKATQGRVSGEMKGKEGNEERKNGGNEQLGHYTQTGQ